MNNCVVVGGGLCGLFSAILLADKCQKVTIVESAKSCGGLLKSVKDDAGVVYDQGTHIPNTTGIDEIDNILFGQSSELDKHWHKLATLKTGSFFNGKWNLANQSVDIRNLPKGLYNQAVAELMANEQESDAENIVDYLRESLGDTITEQVIAPIVQKLYGSDVDGTQLQRNSSVNYFGLTRVLALGEKSSKALKEIPVFDQKLSYHTAKDYQEKLIELGVVEPKYYYPLAKDKGIEYWVEHLVSQAKAKGVEFITDDFINHIEHSNNRISQVTLGKSQQTIPCDFLYWSAPPAFALKAAGMESSMCKADFRTANIFYFNFDQPLNDQTSHFLWNWHGTHKSFRITLYPNLFKNITDNANNISVEVLSSPDEAESITAEMVLQEVKEMALVPENTKVISQMRQTIHNTFPVPTFEFAQATVENYEKLTNSFENVMVSGRFSGKQWFHADVLTAAYHGINEKFSS
ncbi:NAD(P)-binding protein [Thalassotalea sp. M1531]|uniref:NAD(P)-binding protein n=1 Tax=Thalassotalea algicola TaxID=2716224 RepID=A0A7Y0Q7D1_9GAMM|nr:NAD(P)/FAD-dependent oxidoreductase [Thalassotalea algicola]NMP32899.1 NAD(P)-binding protein [Thalassotalea algicola]